MKFTNLSKLLIKFIGGGLVNFPTRYLKEVELEAEGGESGSGESGNNNELISNAKMVIVNFMNNDLVEGDTLYTKDDVELPDKYIYVDNTNKEIYEVDPCVAGMVFPLYLKNRNLNENNIILSIGGPTLYKDARITNLTTMPSGFTNKTSLNLTDYFYCRAQLI